MKLLELSKSEIEQIKKWLEEEQFSLDLNKRTRARLKELSKVFSFDEKGQAFYKNSNGFRVRFFSKEEEELKSITVSNLHNTCHFGRDRFFQLVVRQIYGVTRKEAADVVQRCAQCATKRLMITKPRITPIIAKSPRDRYIADCVDLRLYSEQNNGYKWLLVLVDSFSKFAVVKPLFSKSAEEVGNVFNSIFTTIWPPLILHTDNGKEFRNNTLEQICVEFNIIQKFGRARAPWIQGQVERFNQSIKRWLSSSSASNGELGKWVTCLDKIVFQYNNTPHSTTKQIPSKLFLGCTFPRKADDNLVESLKMFDPELADEIEVASEDAKLNTVIAAEIMRERRRWKYDEDIFEIGDKVFLRNDTDANSQTRRFPLYDHIRITKYEIIERNNDIYTIKGENEEILTGIHISRLKRVHE